MHCCYKLLNDVNTNNYTINKLIEEINLSQFCMVSMTPTYKAYNALIKINVVMRSLKI